MGLHHPSVYFPEAGCPQKPGTAKTVSQCMIGAGLCSDFQGKLSLYLLRRKALSYDLALRGVVESFPSFYMTNAGGTFRTCSGRVTSPLYLSALSWCVRRHLLILAQSVADSLPLSEGSSAEADGEVTRSGMQKAKINSGRTFRITRTVSRPFP